jgi:hypothetical protein
LLSKKTKPEIPFLSKIGELELEDIGLNHISFLDYNIRLVKGKLVIWHYNKSVNLIQGTKKVTQRYPQPDAIYEKKVIVGTIICGANCPHIDPKRTSGISQKFHPFYV